MNVSAVRIGWVPRLLPVLGILWLAGGVPLAAQLLVEAGPRPEVLVVPDPRLYVLAALGALVAGWTGGALLRLRRVQGGSRGRGRLLLLAWSTVIHLLGAVALFAIGAIAAASSVGEPSFLRGFTPPTLVELVPVELQLPARGAAGLAGLGLVGMLGGLVAGYWLIPEGARRRIELVADVMLALAFFVTWETLPIVPPEDNPDAVLLPSIRLVVTALFAVRLVARLLPRLLDEVERIGFGPLVAARHLRSKKSGFLATIGFLAVLAVALSSCSLTTTLSVMGGFRTDLKRKILGNHAHVVIDGRGGEPIAAWAPLLERVRGVPGVKAAAPYVGGEVMVTSASNLSGAVLRGILPEATASVTDLDANIVRGKLGHLDDPEALLRETGVGGSPFDDLPSPKTDDAESPAPAEKGTGSPGNGDTVMEGASPRAREGGGPAPGPPTPGSALLDPDGPGAAPSGFDDLDELDDLLGPPSRPTKPRRDVLPGIVVGQELARTLRLFVGDDVDVVSPLGDLGPAGPIPKSRPFRVAGIFYSGMYEYDMKYAYVLLDTAQRFLSFEDGGVSGIEVKVSEVESAPAVARAIRDALDRDDVVVRDWQELNRNLFGALALERIAMFVALGIAIVVAGFCVFGTLTLMVQEKGREVAILTAMGADRGRIVALFLMEGLLIGLFGAAAGLGLGYVVCFWAANFGVGMNPEVYYIDRLPVHLDGLEFALVGIASVLVCVLATVFPAVAASRLRPVEALRHE